MRTTLHAPARRETAGSRDPARSTSPGATRPGGPTWQPSGTSPLRHDFGAVSVWPAEREALHGGRYGWAAGGGASGSVRESPPAPALAAAADGPIQACRKCDDDSCVDEANCSHEHAPEPRTDSAPRPATSSTSGPMDAADAADAKGQGTKRRRDESDEGDSSSAAAPVMALAKPRQPRPPDGWQAPAPPHSSSASTATPATAASAATPANLPLRARAQRRAEARARAAEAAPQEQAGPMALPQPVSSNAPMVTPTLAAHAPASAATSTPVAPHGFVPPGDAPKRKPRKRRRRLTGGEHDASRPVPSESLMDLTPSTGGSTPAPGAHSMDLGHVPAPEDLAAASSASSGVAPRLRMVEVGAGTGRNSDYMRDLVLRHHTKRDPSIRPEEVHYTATDIAKQGGQGGHLMEAPHGIDTKDQVDANDLGSHFEPNSLDAVVGANPFGDWKTPGASYGLRKIDKRHAANHEMTFDHRFLQSAHTVLREGGKARVFARTQILKPSTRNPGPFANASESDLRKASELGFDVHVRRVHPGTGRKFQRPDTQHHDNNQDLGPFNTEMVFRKRSGPGGVKLHLNEKEPAEALAVDSDEELEPSGTSQMPSSHAAPPAAAPHGYASSSLPSYPRALSSRAPTSAAASTPWRVNDDPGYGSQYGGGFGDEHTDTSHPAAAYQATARPAPASSAAAYEVAAHPAAAYGAAAHRAAAEHVQAMDMEKSPEEENERFRRRDAQDQDERDEDPE